MQNVMSKFKYQIIPGFRRTVYARHSLPDRSQRYDCWRRLQLNDRRTSLDAVGCREYSNGIF